MTDDNGRPDKPKTTINTTYPVWRARDLPFGHGVLSLPQRGETTLEMYGHTDSHQPVETFEGHADVVKEFVWRRGGQGMTLVLNVSPFNLAMIDGADFQLITWSKDRTLRFWPLDSETTQVSFTSHLSPHFATEVAVRKLAILQEAGPVRQEAGIL